MTTEWWLVIRRPKTVHVQAFQWTQEADKLTSVESLDGLVSYAFGVSARGQVSGYSLMNNGQFHGFVWDGPQGEVADLGSFADDFSRAYHIETDGRVAGYDAAPHGPNYAARWNPATGRLQDHGAIGGGFEVAWDINAQGVVVGYTQTPQHTTRAVMWRPSSADWTRKVNSIAAVAAAQRVNRRCRNRSIRMSAIRWALWACRPVQDIAASSFGSAAQFQSR